MFASLIRKLFLTIALCCISLFAFYLAGFRVNVSQSMPIGIWRVEPLKHKLQRGDIAWFCPPDTKLFQLAKQRGYIPAGGCPGGYAHLLKRVVAVSGDQVVLNEQGLWVNGKHIQNSKPRIHDSLGHPMSRQALGSRILQKNSLWLVAGHPNSFDSRYFGTLPESVISETAYSVFTW